MPSLEEAKVLSGKDTVDDAAAYFRGLGAGTCIFKSGAEGSYIVTPERSFRLPAYKVTVSDTTGCGDAYCGGFVAGLCLGYELEVACRLGTAASGLVATGLGSDAGVVDLATTHAFMRDAEILSP
jgi:sugar/nucleoside kinase (ribokinase family)